MYLESPGKKYRFQSKHWATFAHAAVTLTQHLLHPRIPQNKARCPTPTLIPVAMNQQQLSRPACQGQALCQPQRTAALALQQTCLSYSGFRSVCLSEHGGGQIPPLRSRHGKVRQGCPSFNQHRVADPTLLSATALSATPRSVQLTLLKYISQQSYTLSFQLTLLK